MNALALMLWLVGALFTVGFGMEKWKTENKEDVALDVFFIVLVFGTWPFFLGLMVWECVDVREKKDESENVNP